MADLADMCPACGREAGDHTLRQLAECGQNGYSLDWQPLPTDVPGAAMVALEDISGAVDVKSMATRTPLGCFPVLQMVFQTNSGPRSETVLMDAAHLKDLGRLISTSIDKACLAARRLR